MKPPPPKPRRSRRPTPPIRRSPATEPHVLSPVERAQESIEQRRLLRNWNKQN